MPLFSLRGRPGKLGLTDGRLGDCPSSPNCVCSDESRHAKAIEALQLAVETSEAWPLVEQAVRALARTQIVHNSADYIHAECSSSLLGFVDDLELHLRPEDGVIAVRSASRLGYSDFGVNRRRVETLRAALQKQNVVR